MIGIRVLGIGPVRLQRIEQGDFDRAAAVLALDRNRARLVRRKQRVGQILTVIGAAKAIGVSPRSVGCAKWAPEDVASARALFGGEVVSRADVLDFP